MLVEKVQLFSAMQGFQNAVSSGPSGFLAFHKGRVSQFVYLSSLWLRQHSSIPAPVTNKLYLIFVETNSAMWRNFILLVLEENLSVLMGNRTFLTEILFILSRISMEVHHHRSKINLNCKLSDSKRSPS